MTELHKRRSVLLALLSESSSEIHGRTRLQKLVFLTTEDKLSDTAFSPYKFKKYHYGPFCKQIFDDIQALEDRGLVTISKTRTLGRTAKYGYQLTPAGDEIATLASDHDSLKNIFTAAQTIAETYNRMSIRDILQYVYTEYAKYIENSIYRL